MVKFSAAVLLLFSVSAANAFVTPTPKFVSNTAIFAAENKKTPEVPSMAQTHMQGPLTVTGSGKALTKEELAAVKEELEDIKRKGGLKEPDRSFMDDPDIKWRFGGKPDYSVTNLLYLKQRSTVHEEGSLEQIVENLVKTVSSVSVHHSPVAN
jgi:hypothetical protein